MNLRNVSRNYGFGITCLLLLVGIVGLTAPQVFGQEAEVVVIEEEATDAPAPNPVETLDVTINNAVGVLHIDVTKFRFDLLKTLTAKTQTMKLEKAQIDTLIKCATVINSIDMLGMLNQRGFPSEPVFIIRGKVAPQDVMDALTVFIPNMPKSIRELKSLGNGRYKSDFVTFIYGKEASDVPDGMLIISTPKMQGAKMLASIATMTTLPMPATANNPDTTKPIWGATNFTIPLPHGNDKTFDMSGSGDPSGKGSGKIVIKFADEKDAASMAKGFARGKQQNQPFTEFVELQTDGDTVTMTIAGKENLIAEAIDAVFEARERAKRTMSMHNVMGMCKAIVIYEAENEMSAVENQDCLPQRFEDLLDAGCLVSGMLVSPVSGKKPPKWDADKKTLTGEIDYILVQYGDVSIDDLPNPSEMLMVYEKPENYKNEGTNVGYVDGHVTWLKIEDFKKQLKATEDFLKENK